MKNLREEERARTVEVNCKGAHNCMGAVSVVYALTQPDHVAVDEVLVEPRDEPA